MILFRILQALFKSRYDSARQRRYRGAARQIDTLEARVLLTQVHLAVSTRMTYEGNRDFITLVATTTEPVVGQQQISVAISGDGFTEADYILDSTTLVFSDGATKATTNLQIVDDSVVERPEQRVLFELIDPTAGLRTTALSRSALTVFDNDNSVVSIANSKANETDRTIDLTISLTNPVDIDTVASLTTIDETANAGSDYHPWDAQRVSIPAGETSIRISVPIIDDTSVELDETFTVVVSGVEASERDVSFPRQRLDQPAAQSTITVDRQLTPDGQSVIFLASRDGDLGLNLFRVPIDGGSIERLTSDVGPRQEITSFQISPDGQFVVFRADNLREGTYELFSLDLNDGTANNLSYRPSIYGDVDLGYAISPDSQRVIYVAQYDSILDDAVYSVPIGGGAIVRLSHADTASDRVDRFRISNDSTTVVFSSTYGDSIYTELYSVPASGGTITTLSKSRPIGGRIEDFEISPTDAAVVYRASMNYYATSLAGQNHVRLGDPDVVKSVGEFLFSADGSHVAFRANTSSVFIADPSVGQSMRLLFTAFLREFRFTPDSQLLVATSGNGVVLSVAVTGGDATELAPIASDDAVNGDFVISPDSQEVIFAGNVPFQRDVLYAASLDGTSTRELLSASGTAGSRWRELRITPDGEDVFFFSGSGRRQLFTIPRAGGTQIRLNDELVAGGSVRQAYFYSEQADRILYSADQEFNDVFEDFSVPRQGGDVVKLTDWTQPRGSVRSYQLAPGDQHAVYIANHRTSNHEELYSVSLTTNVVSRLSHLLVLSQSVTGFLVSSDGQRVVYLTDRRDLYSVPIDGGTPVRINDDAFGFVFDYSLSPDGQHIVYRGNYLASTPISGGAITTLDSEFVPGGGVQEFVVSPDNQWVVYRADKLVNEKMELFRVPINGGLASRVSDLIDDGSFVRSDWKLSPDLQYVAYIVSEQDETIENLYSTHFFTDATVQLNPPLVDGLRVLEFKIAANGNWVVYRIGDVVDGYEIFSVANDGSGLVRLNSPLSANQSRGVEDFEVSPDGLHVVFKADLNERDRLEIFSTHIRGGEVAQLNPTGQNSSHGRRFIISNDSATVMMELVPNAGVYSDIYAAPLSGDTARMVSRDAAVTEATNYEIVTSSRGRVFYVEDTIAKRTLYQADLRTGRSSIVSAPKVIGNVSDQVQITEDGTAILYRGLATYNNEAGIFSARLTAYASAAILDVDDGRPRFASPSSTHSNFLPKFDWSGVTGSDFYDFQLEELNGEGSVLIEESVSSTSFTPPNPLDIGQYRARVRARFSNGSSTAWGTTVVSVNTAVVVDIPEFYQDTRRPTVTWPAVAGATKYQVVVRNKTGLSALVDDVVTDTNFTFPTDREFGSYDIWVRAIGTDEFRAAWSESVELFVGPSLLTPTSSAFASDMEFQWSDLPGAAKFQLVVARGSELIVDQSNLTGRTYTLEQRLTDGNYKWWLRGFTVAGNAGPWSRSMEFFVGGQPLSVSVESVSEIGVVTVQWLPVAGAVEFEVYLENKDRSFVQRQSGLTGLIFASLALADGEFRIWVRAISSDGTAGQWSTVRRFLVS